MHVSCGLHSSDRPLIAKFWVKKKRSADSHKTRDVEPDDSDSEPTDQSNVLVEMPAHMKNWESIVKRIDTIVPDGATGSPMVYFTLCVVPINPLCMTFFAKRHAGS